MIGTEFIKGQGIGNRLFCYITARSIAQDRGTAFGTAGQEYLQVDFLDLDLGERIEDTSSFNHYQEAEKRLYLKTCVHDMVHGCYVAGADEKIFTVPDNTLLYGNLQDESYFASHRKDLRDWLKVKPEYESFEYTDDDLCILNLRGREYADEDALFLRTGYWKNAMKLMRRENPRMRFMIVTDDEEAAAKWLPGIEAHHFSPEKDYVTLKNAKYLILSNSSFAFFPASTGEHLKKVIAPKYWARYNVSDGYWASEQNIYSDFVYLDRRGELFTPEQCRKELSEYVYPDTKPWAADDPEVLALGKKLQRERLLRKAGQKILRTLRRN